MSSPIPTKDPRAQNPYADLAPVPQSYAPPQAYPVAAQQGYPVGIWKRGSLMIFHKAAPFPDICLRSGLPTEGSRFRQKLTWHPPWITLTILIGVPVYLILAVILTKSAQVDVGMLQKFKSRRYLHMAIGTLVLLASITGFIGGIVMMDGAVAGGETAGGWLMVASALIFLFSVFYLAIAPRMFAVHKITDNYVYLKRVHPDVMKQLSECPFMYDL